MSFFELYDLIIHKKLKFTKLELMDDKNEGIFNALSAQLPSAFNLGFSKTHQEIIDYHNQIKQNTYISCWTKVKDSMAMWLLYSSDKMSIRVKTSKEKLERYLDKWMGKNFWTNHINSPIGTLQTFYPKSKIKEVKYVDINEKIEQIKKFHLKEKKRKRKDIKKYSKLENFPDIMSL